MRNILSFVVFLILSIVFISCAKTPFKLELLAKDSALVYIYVMPDNAINDTNRIPYYEVELNGINLQGKVYPHEYLKYNVIKSDVEITVKRNQIEKKSIKINLVHGNRYYLRVQSFSDDFRGFKCELVDEAKALKEIVDTKYAIYEKKPEEEILVKEVETVKSFSKTDELRKAHQLKVDGLINEDEYLKLKKEILSK